MDLRVTPEILSLTILNRLNQISKGFKLPEMHPDIIVGAS